MYILLTGPAGLFREGVEALLRGFAQNGEVLASNCLTTSWPNDRKPDCVVMDGDCLRLASDELEAVRRHSRTTPVVVLLSNAQRQHVDELMAAGVAGCVEKSASSELFFSALRLAFAGGVYLPRSLVAASLHEPPAAAGRDALQGLPYPDPHLHLTPRQIEVLALLARGRSNKMIARQLDVSEATVKTHLTTIFKALNVSSRGEASVVAARMERIRDAQVDKALNGQIAVGRLLAGMKSQRFRSGQVLFRKGDTSAELFYVEKGTIRLSELGIDMGAGTVLGEIGLFSPEYRRTSTAICKTDCEMRTVSAADAISLYYQEPEFALYLIQLIASRLQADKSRRV
ncbi:two-component system nitrate/nitrite response regulator NarL [Paraburkholderia youngii]|uniref:Cyclic nucleotide-binding domain-containing protein n=3 Tax=Paraburkholderia youngii TaxID=2782701 RepID=A0A7W8L2Q2_9BURK|nr:LuxR C-terminal-related transcriptional regulator [Paraburkholderia youngii]MBB5399100.1 DNA-binding NarL/FixJ family response regulator [Paraburkholderia youngii]NUX56144.1 cyclic nucleotide-binding domain-containing protein [Paraburkholderia youngii]NVI08385.1 cyclic nucleotide-binding domain-containing protein [Paraburkholderia youngii]